MSAIYNLEPQPTGSAILHTTLGEILVELFAKQTPLTCRNFLQLSLDGYYDGTIFHRLVPNFIVQGGDPTGTGNGGESIYDGGAFGGDLEAWPLDQRHGKNAGSTGINFRDEFHSRLKFNRRGLLAMANEGRPDTNGSQFFFTLDKTEELQNKNTIFGRVAGDTIYNLAKIGEAEIDTASERPLYAIKLERIEVLVNPFDDMKKRTRVAVQVPVKSADKDKDKKKKRKAGKQLLSFDNDEGDEEIVLAKKPKFDTRIVVDDGLQDSPPEKKPKAKAAKPTKSDFSSEAVETVIPQPEAQEKSRQAEAPPETRAHDAEEEDTRIPDDIKAPKKSALQMANEEMAALKASMRRTIYSEKPAEEKKKKTALESMIPETSVRGARKRRTGGGNPSSVDDRGTLDFLKNFQSKLSSVPLGKDIADETETGEVDENQERAGDNDEEAALCDLHFIANCQSCTSWDKQEKEDSDDEGWMAHTLSFAADRLGKDLSNRKKAEEELIVIDPREKQRSFKEGKRSERDGRSGGSGRAWDQRRDMARNADMARAASLAGRGAK